MCLYVSSLTPSYGSLATATDPAIQRANEVPPSSFPVSLLLRPLLLPPHSLLPPFFFFLLLPPSRSSPFALLICFLTHARGIVQVIAYLQTREDDLMFQASCCSNKIFPFYYSFQNCFVVYVFRVLRWTIWPANWKPLSHAPMMCVSAKGPGVLASASVCLSPCWSVGAIVCS